MSLLLSLEELNYLCVLRTPYSPEDIYGINIMYVNIRPYLGRPVKSYLESL